MSINDLLGTELPENIELMASSWASQWAMPANYNELDVHAKLTIHAEITAFIEGCRRMYWHIDEQNQPLTP